MNPPSTLISPLDAAIGPLDTAVSPLDAALSGGDNGDSKSPSIAPSIAPSDAAAVAAATAAAAPGVVAPLGLDAAVGSAALPGFPAAPLVAEIPAASPLDGALAPPVGDGAPPPAAAAAAGGSAEAVLPLAEVKVKLPSGGAPGGGLSGSSGGAGEPSQCTKLFIGGLSWQTTEDTLRYYFGKYGIMDDVALMVNKHTGQPRGFGFVRYRERQSVDRVLSEPHTIDGRVVDVKLAVPKGVAPPPVRGGSGQGYGSGPSGGPTPPGDVKKIFVGGLTQETRDGDLREHFGAFGNIIDAVVMMDRGTQRSRGFGFVTFDVASAVARALQVPHTLLGKVVEVKRAEPKVDFNGGRGHHYGHGAQHGAQGYGYGGQSFSGYGGYQGYQQGYGVNYNMQFGGYGQFGQYRQPYRDGHMAYGSNFQYSNGGAYGYDMSQGDPNGYGQAYQNYAYHAQMRQGPHGQYAAMPQGAFDQMQQMQMQTAEHNMGMQQTNNAQVGAPSAPQPAQPAQPVAAAPQPAGAAAPAPTPSQAYGYDQAAAPPQDARSAGYPAASRGRPERAGFRPY